MQILRDERECHCNEFVTLVTVVTYFITYYLVYKLMLV